MLPCRPWLTSAVTPPQPGSTPPTPRPPNSHPRGAWLPDEEFHLALCHMLVGNQWSQHCNRLRGRTENSIKNYWNATLRSKPNGRLRGFLYSYVDRVRGALGDEGRRHYAFADAVRGPCGLAAKGKTCTQHAHSMQQPKQLQY